MISDEDSNEPVMTGTFPFVINTGDNTPQQLPCGIRVVENKIFFYGEVEESSCLELNRILLEVDMKMQNSKNVLGDDFDPKIHLHINTPGGCIFSAFSTVDTIRNLKTKVYTYVDGVVASAGTLMSAIGAKRFIGRHAHMMIHQLSSELYGKFSEMEDDMETCKHLMKVLKDFYKKNTKIPMKKLDELMKHDIYMEADECLSYGIVDEII